MKTTFEDCSNVVDCISYSATYRDFNKDFDWQKSYFELLSWKNTWGLCYDLDILSNRLEGAFVRLVVKDTKTMREKMLTALEELGYQNICVSEYKARVFDPLDIWPGDLDGDEIYEYYFE